MTAAIDPTAETVDSLIHSCQQASEGFRVAAEAATDENLKRLFTIYAHQRHRFAHELQQYAGGSSFNGDLLENPSAWLPQSAVSSDGELLEHCLEADTESLRAYHQALAARMPSRAHFLISAQYSLLQRGHERISGLLHSATAKPASSYAFAARCGV